ncbi:DUF2812 domain-containing protein [Massilia arenosa]|uniref:DUF2812 domain-containing protein n=1 Tax=Zemynaea arenosa TaxID=2561931 RepID=A0A4Y9RSB1_9BURK|nr:DUF2812 domain-containing protein [Massilia arenosa]TFW10815.1 DUF2812 domain-containing protein [Massilia arenosa]
METVSVWQLFWVWQDRSLERWLGEMAARGLHLERVQLCRFVFRRGPAADVVYRVADGSAADQTNAVLARGGWLRVDCSSGWVYWRQSASRLQDGWDARLSKTQRYWRALVMLCCCVVPLLALGLRARGPVIVYVALVLWAYAVTRLVLRLRDLDIDAPAVAP